MGREIRRVPPDWQHPTQPCKHSPWQGGCSYALTHGGRCFIPLYDKSYREAAQEWKDGFAAWERGERDKHFDASRWPADMEYWDWTYMPPDRDSYRPDWPEGSATHYQMYETVSEGTPVSPVFATKEQLVDWLVEQGTSRHAAEQFVKSEWAPSMVSFGGEIRSNQDVYDIIPGPK